ncbi:MAG: hypothetical protein U1E57_09480 [Paenacidovorax caeni]
MVEIDLEAGDDAQVIFETLNARGEPRCPPTCCWYHLLARRAAKSEPQEPLYKQYWARFDDPFWRVESSKADCCGPVATCSYSTFLPKVELTADIPIKHLFVEYKFWVRRNAPLHR